MIDDNAYYNEPLPASDDVVPVVEPVELDELPPTVRTRLVLERELRVCGLGEPTPPRTFTAIERGVLLKMLAEKDSPLSASLRMRAAGVAGRAGLHDATSDLRRMALDETEDRATRCAAVGSYIRLVGDDSRRVIQRLMASRDPAIRRATVISTINHAPGLERLATTYLQQEADPALRRAILRRVSIPGISETTLVDPGI